jgi:hypothetical protein
MKSRPASDALSPSPPAHPRLPNYRLLLVSSVALVGWVTVLLLIALRIV